MFHWHQNFMLNVCPQANYRETTACTKVNAAQRVCVLRLWKTNTSQLQVLWEESSHSHTAHCKEEAALYNQMIFVRLQNFNKHFCKTTDSSNAESRNRTVMSYATAHIGSSFWQKSCKEFDVTPKCDSDHLIWSQPLNKTSTLTSRRFMHSSQE